MTRIFILGILLLTSLALYSQDMKGVKSAIQYEDSLIRRILVYDSKGNLTFRKENRAYGPVVMLAASYFDDQNRSTKYISAHSNLGFSIYTYEYDSLWNKEKIFSQKKVVEEKKVNRRFRTYPYIQNYNSAKELENDSTVSKMNRAGKRLVFSNTFDDQGKKLSEILFKENGDTSSVRINEYDDKGNQVYFHIKGGLGEWSYSYTYDSSGNKLSSKRVNYYGDTTEVNLYTYDKEHNLIEDQYFDRGELKRTDKYYFQNKLKTKRETYNAQNELVRVKTFEYDERNKLIKESAHDIENNKKVLYVWKYEYY